MVFGSRQTEIGEKVVFLLFLAILSSITVYQYNMVFQTPCKGSIGYGMGSSWTNNDDRR